MSSFHLETPRDKPDASPADIDQWVKNIENMRPDIREGFANNLVHWWSETSIAPVLAAIAARRERLGKENWYRLRKGSSSTAWIPRAEWAPGDVMPDSRILFRMRDAPEWTEIVDADQLESKPADYTIRPRWR